MKTSSAKAKGRRCAQKAKDLMLQYKSELQSDDLIITSSGDTGEDIKMSPVARAQLPFSIECKNKENISIWKDYEQACGHGEHTPLLVFTRNRSELMCALKFEDLLKLL